MHSGPVEKKVLLSFHNSCCGSSSKGVYLNDLARCHGENVPSSILDRANLPNLTLVHKDVHVDWLSGVIVNTIFVCVDKIPTNSLD